jgi:hypothetical protein
MRFYGRLGLQTEQLSKGFKPWRVQAGKFLFQENSIKKAVQHHHDAALLFLCPIGYLPDYSFRASF